MMVGITGTPGTGKSSVANELRRRGHSVVNLSDTVKEYIISRDTSRDTLEIDARRWAVEFPSMEGIVEGHLAHYLHCDLVVILRCRPDILKERLLIRGYSRLKIEENVEAEALDVILIETLEDHPPSHLLELDTTTATIEDIADRIEAFIRGDLPSSHGLTDWSGFLGENV